MKIEASITLRTYWKAIKDLIKDYKSAEPIPILKKCSNEIEDLYFTDEEKAECLNEYFVSVLNIDVLSQNVTR